MERKKLLVLSGAPSHYFLVETAKSMGIYTIVTDYREPENSPAKRIADEYWMLSYMDVDGIVARCQQEHIDAVITVCVDAAQRPYQEICERLGLPCFGTKEQFDVLTNKKRFDQLCRGCGVDVIPEYKLEDCLSGEVDYPVFVKPVDSCGSQAQSICYNEQELKKAVQIAAEKSSSGDYLIERYMGGHLEFSVNYVVCDGTPCLIRTTDRFPGRIEDGLSRQVVAYICPSARISEYVDSLGKQVQALVDSLGIRNGPLLLQGFREGNTIRLFDPGFRFSGIEYARLYSEATGVNIMQILVELALGKDIGTYKEVLEDTYRLRGKRDVTILYTLAPGKVVAVEGLDKISSYPGVINVQQKIFVGDVVCATGDVKQRACEISALIEGGPQQIDTLIDYVNNNLIFRGENGNNLHVSSPDPKKVAENYI